MQCSSCRTQLSPEMTTCPFCGSPVSADPPETAESSPYETAVPYIPWQHTSPAAALQPTTPQPFSAWQQPHLIQHEAPRRGLSTGIIVLIIILILLTLGGSGLAYFVVAVRPAQHGAHTPTMTTTNPQDLYAQATSGTPVFNEPMNSQNANDWTAFNGSGCTFTTTGLRMTTPSGVKNAACMAPSTDFTNFAFQVQMTIAQGEQGGLSFREDPLSNNLYLFAIDSSQGIFLLASASSQDKSGIGGGTNATLLAGGTSPAIHIGLGQPNLVAVIAIGNAIYLYINKQYVAGVSDSTSSHGKVGLVGVDHSSNGALDIMFSNVQVWTVSFAVVLL